MGEKRERERERERSQGRKKEEEVKAVGYSAKRKKLLIIPRKGKSLFNFVISIQLIRGTHSPNRTSDPYLGKSCWLQNYHDFSERP